MAVRIDKKALFIISKNLREILCARLAVEHNGMTQDVDLLVAADGQPTKVLFQRWSNANPEQTHRLQPFGGVLSGFQDFDGFRLPTQVEAGNFFGTDAYFPFYIANVSRISFPSSAD